MNIIIRLIGMALAVLGLLGIIGSAGACECGNIGLGQCVLQGLGCLLGLWLGLQLSTSDWVVE
jgi:hypothetical protein